MKAATYTILFTWIVICIIFIGFHFGEQSNKQEHEETETCDAHLERAHTQLFDCQKELAEVFEHYQCEEEQIIECLDDLHVTKTLCYQYVVEALEVKNNRRKEKTVIPSILPTLL